jgi:hypothetical protein
MRERFVRAGSALTVLLGVALVLFGAFRLQYGDGSVRELIAFVFLAVTLVAGYRSVVVHADPLINAVSNTALFAAGTTAYGSGISFAVFPAIAAGQALVAIAVGYFLTRLS